MENIGCSTDKCVCFIWEDCAEKIDRRFDARTLAVAFEWKQLENIACLDTTGSQDLRIRECRRVLRVPAVARSRHGLKSGAGRWMLRVAPEAEERARERKPRVSKGERDREREEGNGGRARVRETARREGLVRGDREGTCVYSGREWMGGKGGFTEGWVSTNATSCW